MTDSRLSAPVAPRWGSQRSELPTRGPLDIKVARQLGWEPFAWQVGALDLAGEYDPASGRPRFRTVGVAVARQNGKTTLVLARVARQLLPKKQTVAYTAQDRSLARIKWMEHVETLMDTPFAKHVERVDRQQNREMLLMKNGSQYIPVTPSSKKAGRSLSIDLAVIDEAYSHDTSGVVGALEPTMITRPLAQLWILSNAGDENSELWWHYTQLGRSAVSDPDSSLCWIEYAPQQDYDKVDVLDRVAWRDANPSMGESGGVDEVALEAAARMGDRAAFCKEHLNLWTSKAASTGLEAAKWSLCLRPELVPDGQLAFGLGYDKERSMAALVSSSVVVDADDKQVTPLEVVDVSDDFDALVERAAANANKFEATIVVQANSPAGSAIARLEELTRYGRKGEKNRVRTVSQPEMARAVGSFYDAVTARRLSHRGDPRLDADVGQVGRRKVGDVFVWDQHGPLSAATLARWGALTTPAPKKKGKSTVASAGRRRKKAAPMERRIPSRRAATRR